MVDIVCGLGGRDEFINRLMAAGFSGSLILKQSEVARCDSEGPGEIERDLESCENEANVMRSF